MCSVACVYMYMCVCTISLGPPNDISRRRKHGYYRIRYWVNSSIVYTYYKESRFALFFLISPSHKRISLFLYMSPRLYLQNCASLIRNVLLINVAVEKIDLLQWKLSLSFSLFLFGTTALSVTKLPLNLSTYLSLPPSLPLPLFHFSFLGVWCIWCVCLLCVFSFTHFPIFPFSNSFSLCKKLRAKLVAVKQRECKQSEHNIFLNSLRICFG